MIMNVGNGAVTFCSSVFQKFFSEVNIVAQFGVSVSHVRVLIQVLAAPLAVSLPTSVPGRAVGDGSSATLRGDLNSVLPCFSLAWSCPGFF